MKDDRVYLRHILDAITKIESYVVVGRETFMVTSHWQDAVIRQLEISEKRPSDYPRTSAPNMLRFRGVELPGCVTC